MADIDLTGRWTGVYFYPVDPVHNPFDDCPPTPFLAWANRKNEFMGGLRAGQIVTTGSRRFQLNDLDDSAPLLRADVEFLDDVTGPDDGPLAVRVGRLFQEYRAALSGQVQASVDDDDMPTDPTVLSYLVTAAMVVPTVERQDLLAAPTTALRLRAALTLLARENLLISELAAVPALDLPGVPPSVN